MPKRILYLLTVLWLVGAATLNDTARADQVGKEVSWKARWIWTDGDPRPQNSYLYARRVVDIPEDVSGATAYVSADSRYQLFINGQLLGRGPARSDPRWQSYDVYEIGPRLHRGRNVIAALIHHYGVNTGAYIEGRAGFLFQANVRTDSGKQLEVLSDETWKVAKSESWISRTPRIISGLGFVEVFDANKEPSGWQSELFDDSGWKAASLIMTQGTPIGPGHLPWRHLVPRVSGATVPPWTHLVRRDIPMLAEEERLPVAVMEYGNVERNGISRGVMIDIDPLDVATQMSMEPTAPLRVGRLIDPANALRRDGRYTVIQNNSTPENGVGLRDIYMVIDFGTIVTGRIRITLDGVKDGVLDLGYVERLTDGRVIPNMGQRYADRYIMRDGMQTWEPYDWKCYRYVLLTFRDCYRPVKLDSVSINFTSYPVGSRGSFKSSDELINKIWEACRYTMQLNMQDAFMDTAWREQRQWVEDARMELQVNYYAFGDTKLPARYLRQVAQSQQQDGMIASVYPAPPQIVADDCLEWVLTVWDNYMYTGDKALLSELYPAITKLMAAFEPFLNSNGLLGELPYEILFDLMAASDYRGVTSGLNAEYYGALRVAANMSRVLGDTERADHYERLARTVRARVNELLWSKEKRAYSDTLLPNGHLSDLVTQMSNGMALFVKIPPRERMSPMVSYMLNPRNPVPEASPFGVGYLLPALFDQGFVKEGLALIRHKYGDMIRAGATTIWEYWRFDGDPRSGRWATFPRAVAHAGGTIAGFCLQKAILGVAATKPGFEEFSVDPEVLDLSWAKGVIPTVKGDIPVSWSRSEHGLSLQITVPSGSSAEIGLPTLGLPNPRVADNGRAQNTERKGDRLRFRVAPGAHTVQLTAGTGGR